MSTGRGSPMRQPAMTCETRRFIRLKAWPRRETRPGQPGDVLTRSDSFELRLSGAHASRPVVGGPTRTATASLLIRHRTDGKLVGPEATSFPARRCPYVWGSGARQRGDEMETRECSSEHGTSQSRPVWGSAGVRAVDRWVPTRAKAALLSDLGFDAGCRGRPPGDLYQRMASAGELRGAGLPQNLALPHCYEPLPEYAARCQPTTRSGFFAQHHSPRADSSG